MINPDFETRRVEDRQEWIEAIHATIGLRPPAGSTPTAAVEFACTEARRAALEECLLWAKRAHSFGVVAAIKSLLSKSKR